jgi:DNA polymerase-4/DNA polymerase V
MSYEAIAAHIKHDLERSLGITFSVGLAPSKVLAKIASKWDKPSGLTVIPGKKLPQYLGQLAAGDVWGIGPQTAAHLAQFGIRTALDFALQEPGWVKQHLTKPHQEIWQELRGTAVLPLETEARHDFKSISKTKTFTPPSNDRTYVFAQLSKNIENACIKARRHHLIARKVCFFLRTQAFEHDGYDITLTRATAFPNEIIRLVDVYFDQVFQPRLRYRLTGVVLTHLTEDLPVQLDLFDDVLKVENTARIYNCVDTLAGKYGKHTLFLGASMPAMRHAQHTGERADVPARKRELFKGETARKRLGIPMLGDVL